MAQSPAGPTTGSQGADTAMPAVAPVRSPDLETCDPEHDADQSDGRTLRQAIGTLIDNAGPPDDPSDLAALVGSASLAERSALYHDLTFWTAPEWASTTLDGSAIRRQVDALRVLEVWIPSQPSAEGRATLIQHLADQAPADLPRLLVERRLRDLLLADLEGLGRLRVLHAIARPSEPIDDPYVLLQIAVEQGGASDLNAAWSEASMDAAIVLRLAEDAPLREAIHRIDPELAQQVTWELQRSLKGESLHTEDAVVDAAVRRPLRALGTLVEGSGTFGPDLRAIDGEVLAFRADVAARLQAGEVEVEGGVSQGVDRAVDTLRARFRDFYGVSLATVLSERHELMAVNLRDHLNLDQPSHAQDEAQAAPSFDQTEAIARSMATQLHRTTAAAGGLLTVVGLGDSVGDAAVTALEQARAAFWAHATTLQVTGSQRELQVLLGMAQVARFYSAQYQPIAALLLRIEDRDQRRRVAQMLGVERDVASEAWMGLVSGMEAGGAQEASTPGRDGALQAHRLLAERTGVSLGAALRDEDHGAAVAAAEAYYDHVKTSTREGTLDAQGIRALYGVVAAAANPFVGDLTTALASVQDSDKLFRLLGQHSTGAALRKAGDDRSDAVLGAEYSLKRDLRQVFEHIASDRPSADLLTKAKRSAAQALGLTPPTPSPAATTLLTTTYHDLFGIDLVHHIRRSRLPDDEKDALTAGLGTTAPSATTELPPMVRYDYFRLGTEVVAGMDASAVSDAEQIEAMTHLHVQHLNRLLQGLPGTVDKVHQYMGDLKAAEGWQRVCQAYEAEYGFRPEFHLHRAKAMGPFAAAGRLERGLSSNDLSQLAIELRDHADAHAWDMLLVRLQRCTSQEKEVLLQDGETVHYLRQQTLGVPTVWQAVYKSLHDDLDPGALLADESASEELIEEFGTLARWAVTLASAGIYLGVESALGTDPLEDLYGVDETEHTFDSASILDARPEDLADEDSAPVGAYQRRIEGAQNTLDPSVQSRLDHTLGRGDDRVTAELTSTFGKDGEGTSQAAQTEDARLWRIHHLRAGIEAMSAKERARNAADPRFLLQIDEATRDYPADATQLYDLLLHGKGGTETSKSALADPWSVVATLSDMDADQRARIALDPEQRAEWDARVARDPDAQAHVVALWSSATELTGTDLQPVPNESDLTPIADTAYTEFVTRHTAVVTAALHGATGSFESGVIEAAATVGQAARDAWDSERSPEGSKQHYAKEGYSLDSATTEVWRRVGADVQEAFLAYAETADRRSETHEGQELPQSYKASGSLPDMTVRLLITAWHGDDSSRGKWIEPYRAHGSSANVTGMKAIIKAMNEMDFLRNLTSVLQPGINGARPLDEVYRTFRRIEQAAGQSNSPEAADARTALLNHPVEVCYDAGLLSALGGASSNKSIDSLSVSGRTAVLAAIRERMTKVKPDSVVAVLRADPSHADLLWNPMRTADIRVRAARDDLHSALESGMLSVDMFTGSDEEAAARWSAMGSAYQDMVEDQTVSNADASRLADYEALLGVSVKEFREARERVASITKTVAATAIGAVVTALSGGSASPVAVALISAAATGGSAIAIDEVLKGDEFDAEQAMAELAVDLLKTAVTGHMAELWRHGSSAAQVAMLTSPRGRQLHLAHKALQSQAESLLGPLGIKLASAGVDTATGGLGDIAFKMLDPSMYRYGWDAGLKQGMLDLEAHLKGLPEETVRAMLEALASEAGERAVATMQGTPTRSASVHDLGVDLDAPDPKKEPKRYRDYLRKRLAKLPAKALETSVESAASGTVTWAGEQGAAMLQGQDGPDLGALGQVLVDSGLDGTKAALKGARSSLAGAHSDLQDDKKAVALQVAHIARMKAVRSIHHGMSEEELGHFEVWSKSQRGAAALYSESGDLESLKAVQARHEVEQFRSEVLDPLHMQIETLNNDWGEDLGEARRSAYTAWVLSEPEKAAARVKVTPRDFSERLDATTKALADARESVGYAVLSDLDRAWFEHAASRPARFADLTSGESLPVALDSLEDAEAFGRTLEAAREQIARHHLRHLLTTLDEPQQRAVKARTDDLVADLDFGPTDDHEAIVRDRVQALLKAPTARAASQP